MSDNNKGNKAPKLGGYGNLSVGGSGLLNMIDTFDRPGDAFARGTYAESGTYAVGGEDKPMRRIPKAGAYAAAGVGHARAEFSIFEAEAKGPNASASAGASVLGASAIARAELASASASAGPLTAKVGLAADTGVEVGPESVEVKVLGTGISLGRRMAISLFGTEIGFDLW